MEHSTRLAHISEDGTRTQTVYDHLAGTARLAGSFAAPFGAQSEAEFAAWLHDVGKYSDAFQLRLKGGPKVDHSTAGAQEAWVRQHLHAAFAVAGHHSGLPDGGSPADDPGDATLFGRSKKPVDPYDGWQEVTLPASTPPAWACADPLSLAFFTRMLYSCLVDADFIDTETFMDGKAAPRGSGTDIAALRDIVSAQAQRYLRAESPSPVSIQRNTVLRACLEKGAHGPQGLYTLTVPTGGGKTFASLAFALEHAAAQKMKRVIYVIPYMSIIDQTAAVFSGLLGAENVLADFSNAEYKTVEQDDLTPAQYRQMLASENWDAPVVVTTAVQFFESLYANRSSRCRKLHNLADSVIIFDEAQTSRATTLPPASAPSPSSSSITTPRLSSARPPSLPLSRCSGALRRNSTRRRSRPTRPASTKCSGALHCKTSAPCRRRSSPPGWQIIRRCSAWSTAARRPSSSMSPCPPRAATA